MKTVVLHGKLAAGRVALVDDGDYELVSQYRWNVLERPATEIRRGGGPYAATSVKRSTVLMHKLITGWAQTDHHDHDGLNNQRYNLRQATHRQNSRNSRGFIKRRSQYKGVTPGVREGSWCARITPGSGRPRTLCTNASELQAAYIYDAAARELFGEFACVNFPDGPTQAMRERSDWSADCDEQAARALRPIPKVICDGCGEEFQPKTRMRKSRWCNPGCRNKFLRETRAADRAM